MAFTGGLLPALLWLWFWLREDRVSPEPKKLIIATFFAGMGATLVSLVLENTSRLFLNVGSTASGLSASFFPIALWALIEETSKFSAAYVVALRRRENDEPVDNMVYLITAALGFAALETAFFLVSPIESEGAINSIITGNLRFIGTAPLHIISSATVGIFMAFAFCRLPGTRRRLAAAGILAATLLHTLFNFFILKDSQNLLAVFAVVWVGIVILLLFFEKVKRINRSCVY